MQLLTEFLKEQGAKSASKVSGPNGAFISAVKEDGSTFTLPVGKRSQEGSLADYNVLIAESGQAIATVNNYEVQESVDL